MPIDPHKIPLISRAARLFDAAFDQLRSIGSRLDKIDTQIAVLTSEIHALPTPVAGDQYAPKPPRNLGYADVIVTPNEVNPHHGTGVLVLRLFKDSREIVSIRSRDEYEGRHDLGEAAFRLPGPGMSRPEIFTTVHHWLVGKSVGRVLCVPYYPDDVLAALAVKELFNAPLCTYVMDDQNIFASGISDELMDELLTKSALRLAISPEMRLAYQNKFRHKFWVLPPVVPQRLISDRPIDERDALPASGIIAGNIWSQQWLDALRKAVKRSGFKIDWYCNSGPNGPGWLNFNKDELQADGVTMHPALSEAELVIELRKKSFALVPIGAPDEGGPQLAVTRLSLPSRLPFIAATSNTPIVVLGDRSSAAAHFVQRFEIGTSCDYEPASFVEAVKFVTAPDRRRTLRGNAAAAAEKFSSAGIADWIWNSLTLGAAFDQRFEQLMPPAADEFAYHVEAPVPPSVHVNFVPVYTALRRLKTRGFQPDFVIDVGASNGPWSHAMSGLFPGTRFILIEPLASRYDRESRKLHIDSHANFELIEAAVSNKPGRLSLHLASDLYNSSIFPVPGMVKDEGTIEVRCTTLDEVAREKRISGHGLVKIDVQHAEHLVIEGGMDFISRHVDALVLEITLAPPYEGAKGLLEMINLMERIGFRYSDDVGEWRSATDGALEQKDILFVRQGKFQ